MAEILEACMVICFGISWPIHIATAIKSKTSKGKSVIFLVFVLLGYVFAILSKIVSDAVNWVFWFYVFNFFMVSTDIVMFYVNKKRDIRAELYSSNS